MSDAVILNGILDSTAALREEIRGARANGTLTNGEAEQCFSALARIPQVMKAASQPKQRVPSTWDRPLPEWMRWPNRSMPCPKCNNEERGRATYHPESAMGPERMQHFCMCGYSIYTKPADQSADDVF